MHRLTLPAIGCQLVIKCDEVGLIAVFTPDLSGQALYILHIFLQQIAYRL